jgi:hypothetical protein
MKAYRHEKVAASKRHNCPFGQFDEDSANNVPHPNKCRAVAAKRLRLCRITVVVIRRG